MVTSIKRDVLDATAAVRSRTGTTWLFDPSGRETPPREPANCAGPRRLRPIMGRLAHRRPRHGFGRRINDRDTGSNLR